MSAVSLAFEEFGGPNNAPLIILHGFFASSRNWRQVAQKLAVNHHVYVPDMRNHGASPHHPVMDYPAMAADLLRFINQHGLDQQGFATVSLLGHSMGGKLAMWFALNHPNRLNKLIVADIAPVSYQHTFDNLISALTALPLAEISNRKQADIQLANAIPELNYRQFLLQNLILKDSAYHWRIDLDIFRQTAPDIAAFPDTNHLMPFCGKALFIGGANSGYVKGEDVRALFPDATLHFIADAGHWLHVQQPAEFVAQVMCFLETS
ncbi:MAG: alpha/beta fold hydrolase [Methylovulum sp.]|nr:alpha/beta fold hydrolase [Methylovulum sp.]